MILEYPPVGTRDRPRRNVSYFEHERRGGVERKINFESDAEEIVKAGFNSVTFCVSEETLASRETMLQLEEAVCIAKGLGLAPWADPWGMGLFGGEGVSYFNQKREAPCFCNSSYDELQLRWIEEMWRLGMVGIFWDEPEWKKGMSCDNHNEVEVVARYSRVAKGLGLLNSVCIPAQLERMCSLREFAALESIDDIGTDPYWPNAFGRISLEKRIAYISFWAHQLKWISGQYGKSCHLWLQGFNIREGDLTMIQLFTETMAANGVNDWAFWGFKGCESLFDGKDFPGTESAGSVWNGVKKVFGGGRVQRSTDGSTGKKLIMVEA